MLDGSESSQDQRTKITDDTQRWLWGASGGVCEYWWEDANCVERLMQTAPSGAPTFVGQTAHVVPIGGSGPRAGHESLGGGLDAPENLMLMCYKHHRFVDKDPTTFTVQTLADMKRRWEDYVDPLRRLTGAAQTANQDYDRLRDFVAAGFKLARQDWESFVFNVSGGRGRPAWLTDARIEARATAIEVEARWVRPSTIEVFSGHADLKFEESLLRLSKAMRDIDYLFGEGVSTQKPPGWEAYDWTTPDPSDWPEMATMTLKDYMPWLARVVKVVEQAEAAREAIIAEVVRRDHTRLNNWPS